jgi:hypothetical protein
MSHFILTFAVYGSSQNLKYFSSSPRKIVVFFIMPILLFVTFDLLHAFQVANRFPLAALIFFTIIRFFDFFHLNRQTFGVLQLLMRRTTRPESTRRRTEKNVYLLTLTLLLGMTFLNGGVTPLLGRSGNEPLVSLAVLQPLTFALSVVAIGLFMKIVHRIWKFQTNTDTGQSTSALIYLVVQTLSVVMAMVWLPLYAAALAIHYVEYHILMQPRCFQIRLDASSRWDRGFNWLRSRPLAFYGVILALAALATGGAFVGMGQLGIVDARSDHSFTYLAMIAVFDGLFVVHYFLEMYIWRFSDPHFRQSLGKLYFQPKPG